MRVQSKHLSEHPTTHHALDRHFNVIADHNLTAARYPDSVVGENPATAVGTPATHCLRYIWQDRYIDVLQEVRVQ